MGSELRAELLFICGPYRRERKDSETRRDELPPASSSFPSGLLNLFLRLTKVTFDAEIIFELLTTCDPFDLELFDGFFVCGVLCFTVQFGLLSYFF